MSSEMPAPARPPVAGRFSLPRFPASWAVESAAAERIFARLLWLLVPLQYYVVTHVARGLSADDLIPAVVLSLMSVVVIFLLSCVAAWLASSLRPLDPAHGDTLTGRVRMWVVALMICTAAGYLLLALSLAATHALQYYYDVPIYIDLVTSGLRWLIGTVGLGRDTVEALTFQLQTLSNFVYAFAALLVIMLVHRVWRRSPASPAAGQEPGAFSVALIVAILMIVANYVATMD